MVDFKKLLNQTPEERAKADEEIEKMREAFLESTKDDPAVKLMRRLCGDEE